MREALRRYLDERLPGATAEPLAGDASTRRFWRLRLGERRTWIVMDYGAPFSGETDDVRLTRVFLEAGLPVAQVIDLDGPAGCLVLEDLGDLQLETAWKGHPDLRRELLLRSVALAARIATDGTEVLRRSERRDGPRLDAERFRFEMSFFLEHYAAARGGRELSGLATVLEELADCAAEGPQVLCHRDFHSRNILLTEEHALRLVDIQDARWGPDTYDLASILVDPYIDADPALQASAVEAYRIRVGAMGAGFRERLSIVAAQRRVKALGTFGFQRDRRGSGRYEAAAATVIERLSAAGDGEPEPVRRARRALGNAGLLDLADRDVLE